MLRVLYVEIDAPHLRIARIDHPYLLGRLHEVHRVRAAVSHETRHARRHAARSRREGDLPGEHFVIVLLHVLLHPRLQVRIGEVRNPIGGLPACAVGNEGVRRITADGRQVARNGLEAGPAAVHPDPPDLVRREIRRPRLLLRQSRCGRRRCDNPGQDTAGNEPRTQCERGHLRSSSRCLRYYYQKHYRIFALSVRESSLSPQAWSGKSRLYIPRAAPSVYPVCSRVNVASIAIKQATTQGGYGCRTEARPGRSHLP